MKMPKTKINLKSISLFVFLLGILPLQAQQKGTIIDQIIAIVGDEVILESEVQYEMGRAKAENKVSLEGNVETQVIENMLISKLLKEQAIIDSIVVTPDEVERQLDQRMADLLKYASTKEKLEQYFKKPMAEIRNELRDATRDQIIIGRMQEEIVKDVKVTPAEVRAEFYKFPKDSLPLMPEKMMIQQITKKPAISQKERDRIQKQLRKYREDIYKGGSFATLAVLHSEDLMSATKGGELGYAPRTRYVEEFSDAAFSLKPGKISKIVETEFGFHIIQLIDRKGDLVNVRHILIKPVVDEKLKEIARKELDSVRTAILDDKISFNLAAAKYSDDKDTRNNSGLLMNLNMRTGKPSPYFKKTELPVSISQHIVGLKENELSEIFYAKNDRKPTLKFFRIKKLIPEHKANLEEDWEIFENLVLGKKKQEVLNDWVKDKIKDTYIEINKEISRKDFKYDWDKK